MAAAGLIGWSEWQNQAEHAPAAAVLPAIRLDVVQQRLRATGHGSALEALAHLQLRQPLLHFLQIQVKLVAGHNADQPRLPQGWDT